MEYPLSQQRRLARIMALPPDKQAFFAEEIAQAAGQEQAQRELRGMQLGNAKDAREAELALTRDRLATSQDLQTQQFGLQRSALDETRRQNRGAEMLGVTNLPLNAAIGVGDLLQERERMKKLGAIAALYG
jgi:hypothetical protein